MLSSRCKLILRNIFVTPTSKLSFLKSKTTSDSATFFKRVEYVRTERGNTHEELEKGLSTP